MFKEQDRVKHKAWGKGKIAQISDEGTMENNILVFHDNGSSFYCKKEDLTLLVPKVICGFCGLDYPEDLLESHVNHSHKEEMEQTTKQFEKDLINDDSITKFKAEQYDKIFNMVFMSCGIIVDGFSTQYIIDQSIVCDQLLKIIIQDTHLDRSQFVESKENFIREDTKKERAW